MVGESRLSFSAIWAQFRMVHWPRRYARRSFDRMRLLDFVPDDDLRRRRLLSCGFESSMTKSSVVMASQNASGFDMYKSQYGVPSPSPSIFSRMSGGGKRGPTPARHPSAVHMSFGIVCQHGYAKWLNMVFFFVCSPSLSQTSCDHSCARRPHQSRGGRP